MTSGSDLFSIVADAVFVAVLFRVSPPEDGAA